MRQASLELEYLGNHLAGRDPHALLAPPSLLHGGARLGVKSREGRLDPDQSGLVVGVVGRLGGAKQVQPHAVARLVGVEPVVLDVPAQAGDVPAAPCSVVRDAKLGHVWPVEARRQHVQDVLALQQRLEGSVLCEVFQRNAGVGAHARGEDHAG